MLELENYVPIDIEKVSKEYLRIYNVPGNRIPNIIRELETINNEQLPVTLRTFLLNHIPICIFKLIK